MPATEPLHSLPASEAPPWHAQEPEAALWALEADAHGLSTEAAQQRRARYDPNP